MSKYIPKRFELSDITLPNEIWKDLPNFDGNYKISNLGRVYSLVCKRILSSKAHKYTGYVVCPLGDKEKNIKRVGFRVHRLVAEAFIQNPENKKEVNHINKNRADNRVENLEWCTGTENINHRFGNGANWHSGQGRIAPASHSVMRRKLNGLSNVIIPILNKMIPMPSFQELSRASV
jgi:hypothetical protein